MKGYIGFCSAWHKRCVAVFRVSFKEHFGAVLITKYFFMILLFSNAEIRECVSLNKRIWSIIINTI